VRMCINKARRGCVPVKVDDSRPGYTAADGYCLRYGVTTIGGEDVAVEQDEVSVGALREQDSTQQQSGKQGARRPEFAVHRHRQILLGRHVPGELLFNPCHRFQSISAGENFR
jgi:hypothetical protein